MQARRLDLPKKIAISDGMAGRPPNGTKQFQVQLEPAQVARIDAVTKVASGKSYGRSAFIREAVEEKLTAVEAELHRRKG